MIVNTDFKKWSDKDRFDYVYADGGYVSKTGYGVKFDESLDGLFDHYYDNNNIELTVNLKFCQTAWTKRKIHKLEIQIKLLEESLK